MASKSDFTPTNSVIDPNTNYIQLSKPYLSLHEIEFMEKNNKDLNDNIRNFKSKTKETFQILIKLIMKLKLPIKIMQNLTYFYQKFYLLNDNYKKYSSLHFEVGLTSLFISLKLNDFIKKINIVISEGFNLKGVHLSNNEIEENKKILISLERKILEFQSFDFRNFLVEDFLIKFLKFLNNDKILDNNDLMIKNFSYLSWTLSNDLYLTTLNLQYPAHYNAIISIKCAMLIFNEINKNQEEGKDIAESDISIEGNAKKSVEDNNSKNNTKINYNLKSLLAGTESDSFILPGCNILLEYYIDNYSVTFLKSYLQELDFKIDDKKLIDLLINLKIEINNNISNNSDKTTNIIKDDLFFKPRDTEIAKIGAIRFLYNKETYLNEVKLYK